MEKPWISVIVPVYNVERYLEQCIESIVNQTVKDMELILVDDGSTDTSPAICDSYAEQYDNISVIHKKNGGLSDARNVGLQAAQGEYVLFVDSDDYISEGVLTAIAKTAQESAADVLFLEAQKVYEDGTTEPMGDGITRAGVYNKSKDEVLKFLTSAPKLPAAAWLKLLKRSMLIEAGIVFEKGLLSEDIDWCIGLFLAANSFDYCETVYYNYRQGRAGSISNTANPKHIRDFLYIMDKWIEKAQNLDGAEKEFVLSALAYEYPIVLLKYAQLSKAQRKELGQSVKQALKQKAFLLGCKSGTRYTLMRGLCKMVPLGVVGEILKWYYKLR